jgi:hypothetical protein
MSLGGPLKALKTVTGRRKTGYGREEKNLMKSINTIKSC